MKISISVALACLFLSSCSHGPSYYVDAGNRFFASKSYDDAAIQYRKALLKNPNFAEAQYRLGLVEMERGNGVDAYVALNRALELDPKNWEARAKLADLCVSVMIAGRIRPQIIYNRVIALADEFLARDPNSFDGLRLKGYIAGLDKKPAESIGYFRRAHQLKPDDAVVAVALAEVLLKSGQAAEGESIALQTIAANQSYAPAYEALYRYYAANNRAPAAEAILRRRVENIPREFAGWVQLAAHLHQLRRDAEVPAVLDRLLNNPKDFPNAWMIVGDFYANIGNLEEATRKFTDGASKDPPRKIDYLKRISIVQEKQGKREEALGTVREILKLKPEDEESLGFEGSLLRAGGDPAALEQALEIFRGLVKKNPNNAIWQMSLGRSLVDVGKNPAEARHAFQEAIRLDPALDTARYLLAEFLIHQGNADDALAVAQQILAKNPEDVRARFLRLNTLRVLKNYEAAGKELKTLERQYPKSYEVQFQSALLDLAEGKNREASELFQKLYKTSPTDFRPLEGLVNSRFAQQQIGDALRLLDSEVKKSPETVQLRLLLAATASRGDDHRLASQEYEHLLKLDPKSSGLYISLGREQMLMGEPQKALVNFQKAESIAPNEPSVLQAVAVAFEGSGRPREAIERYRRILQIDPENPVVENNLAYLLAETGGDLDEAMRLIQQAVRRLPQHPDLADTLGWIYLKKNMTGSAQQVFAGLVKKDPRNPSYQYHLGSALYAQGDKAGARNALKVGLESKPSPATEKKIRELLALLG